MRIGILSDTHGYFHPALPEYLGGVDLILHAGDIGTEDVLDQLEALAPTMAVWGNIDGQALRLRTEEHARFKIAGVTFWMTHIAGHPKAWQRRMDKKLALEPPDIFICGHSHILRVERVRYLKNMLYVNPGAAGRQGFHQVKTCLRMRLDNGKPKDVEVVHLDPS